MDTKVGFLFLSQHLQDAPAGGAALEGGVCEGLGQDDVDDLLAQEQLPALAVLDDVGDGGSGGGARLGIGVLEVGEDGQDLGLAQGGQLRVRGRLDLLGDGVASVGGAAAVAPRLAHGGRIARATWGECSGIIRARGRLDSENRPFRSIASRGEGNRRDGEAGLLVDVKEKKNIWNHEERIALVPHPRCKPDCVGGVPPRRSIGRGASRTGVRQPGRLALKRESHSGSSACGVQGSARNTCGTPGGIQCMRARDLTYARTGGRLLAEPLDGRHRPRVPRYNGG